MRRDPGFWWLFAALGVLSLVFIVPTVPVQQPVFSYLFVVDITRSMNTADYHLDDQPISRLEFVKQYRLKNLGEPG